MSDQTTSPTPPKAATLPAEFSVRLRSLTPARIGLAQAGESLATREVLDFQLAHGQARDAVHAALQTRALLGELKKLTWLGNSLAPLILHSCAADRPSYLKRPDLGRKLDEPSLTLLARHSGQPHDLSIVLADGLSALAVERHAIPVVSSLLSALERVSPTPSLAPITIVEQARVAVGDTISQAQQSNLVIVLIGERPGLSSHDSLGAYITWRPQPGRTTDAERNCISNIRIEGLNYAEAAGRLLYYIQEATSKQTTGIALKDPQLTAALQGGEK